jgi:hypothetical protein
MMIIPIAEFQTKNGTETISVERVEDCYYGLTYEGYRGIRYNTLSQARANIADLYGKYRGFKLLAEVQK